MKHHLKGLLVVFSILLGIFLISRSCSEPDSKFTPKEEYTETQKFWDNYIVKCGDSYFVRLNVIFQPTMQSTEFLFQFKSKPSFTIESTQKDFTQADVLNGYVPYEFLGMSHLESAAPYREGVCSKCSPADSFSNIRWSEWRQGKNSSRSDTNANLIVVKDKGQWAFYHYRGKRIQERGIELFQHGYKTFSCSELPINADVTSNTK